MNTYEQIVKDFSSIPQVGKWEEVRNLLYRIALTEPKHWLLPQSACRAVGGNDHQAFPGVFGLGLSQISIMLVDDMLDADPRGEYLEVGSPAAANMAIAFKSVALFSIAQAEINQQAKLAALDGLNEMFLTTALGQHWDVQSAEIDEAAYWRIARTKSSPFFGAAFHLGALMGGASASIATEMKALGRIYGEMIQIHDDLHDAMAVPANPDWIEGRSPLPILFARLVDHPARARFKKLLQKAGSSPKALKEAQEILIRCGALSYCVDELLNRYETVKGILSAMAIARPGVLLSLFDDVVAPVWSLFQAAGEDPFE